MRRLEVVEPEGLYDFARQRGLLADPEGPRPAETLHRLPSVKVYGPQGLIACLGESSATTTTGFRLRFPEASIWGGNLLPLVYENWVLPGGFSHQQGWVTDAANRTNTNGWVEIPPLPVVDVPLDRPQLLGFASHWGHFFTDTLDRLTSLADADQLDRPMLVDAKPPCPNAMELMYLSGLLDAPLEVHRLTHACMYRARGLEVQTLTSRKPAAPVATFLRLRRAMFDRGLDQVPAVDRPMFVGRQKVNLRKLRHQAELAAQVESEGIADWIYPELLSIEEAARVFAGRRTIILPIGSAKFNLIFCAPGARVICIAPRGYAESEGGVTELLRHMCAALGHQLVFYACPSTPATGPRAHMLLHHDLHIELTDLRNMLRLQ